MNKTKNGLYQFTRFFIIHRITAHNRTSHSKSTDDYGGHYRIANTKLFQRVCFGCFLLYVAVEHPCRSPPERLEFLLFNF